MESMFPWKSIRTMVSVSIGILCKLESSSTPVIIQTLQKTQRDWVLFWDLTCLRKGITMFRTNQTMWQRVCYDGLACELLCDRLKQVRVHHAGKYAFQKECYFL